ncbi:MAG: toll/interleukin-1 receptor domain-containing protein [Chloroflexota bacterium]
MTGQIFISYSRADTSFVSNLISDLISQGLDVWMDQRNISAGQRWDNTIQQALQACDVFVIVLSPNSVASENVLDELSYAISENKRIIPVLYRDCEIPYRLARIQFIDFRGSYQGGLQHLIAEIKQQAHQQPATTRPRGNNRALLTILGIAAAFLFCAALGIGAYILAPYILPTQVPVTEPPIPGVTPPTDIPARSDPTIMPSPTFTPEPPHAPAIENTFGVPLYDETQQLITVAPGEQYPLKIMDLWGAPEGAAPSCASGFMVLTWMVRDPYPTGGEDLQILSLIPMGDGRTEVMHSGAQGSTILGYCDEIFLFNNSLRDYRIEIRYASGLNQ